MVQLEQPGCAPISRSWPAFSRLDRLLPIGPRAKGGSALRLQTYTFNRKYLCSAGTGSTLFFNRGVHCDQKPSEIKMNRAVFNATNHHNSLFNRNNDHCFPSMCSLSFFNSRRGCFEAVFCSTYKRFVFGRSIFNCYYTIRFDSHCFFHSYCYLSSERVV